MQKKKVGTIAVIAVSAVLVFLLLILGFSLTKNLNKPAAQVDSEKTTEDVARLLKKVRTYTVEPRKAAVELDSSGLEAELPDISKYPLAVEGRTPLNIEIFSSTEKSGNGVDGWLNEVAAKFNKSNPQVDGQAASVSIRSVASGLCVDYIVSGKHVPDAFTPSNELWGKMLEAKNIQIELKSKRITGNVTGILMEKNKYNAFVKEYGSVNMQSIIEATRADKLAMGYTNPFVSSTGLNFLISMLNSIDRQNPLGEEAVAGFEDFQRNVPFVAYSTIQMRDAAKTGALDSMLLEYQTYVNTDDLRGYVFTPFGVRHDSPMYSIGALSPEKDALLEQFIQFCESGESQALATKYGFNGLDDYISEEPEFDGGVLLEAQQLWKEKKDYGRPVVAVFVADISGSMEGPPINELKNSLINASQYINKGNYIGLVSYNSDVYVNLPIAEFDLNHRAYFTGAVEDLSAVGGTATFDAVLVGMDMLMKKKEELPDAKLMLFVLSDGETNTGYTLDKIRQVVAGSGIPIHTIGYNADLSALQAISSINEAAATNADSDDVVYVLRNMFNAQM